MTTIRKISLLLATIVSIGFGFSAFGQEVSTKKLDIFGTPPTPSASMSR